MSHTVYPNPITFGRITHLMLGHFKAFGKAQRIPLRPITLIYGRNNSGKSSIIQSLLWADDTLRTGWIRPNSITKNGRSVLVGDTSRIVHGRAPGGKIEFGWEWSNPGSTVGLRHGKITHWVSDIPEVPPLMFRAELNRQELLCLLDEYDFHSAWEGNSQHPDLRKALVTIQELLAKEFRRKIESGDTAPELAGVLDEVANELDAGSFGDGIFDLLFSRQEIQTSKYEFPPQFVVRSPVHECFQNLMRREGWGMVHASLGVDVLDRVFEGPGGKLGDLAGGLSNDLGAHVRHSATERGAHLLYQWLHDVWIHFQRPLNSLLSHTRYLAAVRSEPARVLLHETGRSQELPTRNADWNLSADRIERANAWLKKHSRLIGDIEIRYEAWKSVRRTRKGGTTGQAVPATLYLYDRTRELPLRLEEVGFGVSQFIPVLLACYEEGGILGDHPIGTLLVEEPEAHIHPALQAEVGDLFIDAVRRDRGPLAYVICETHSEHILLRIMRRIREGQLSPDLVSVLYVETSDKESTVREMPLNEQGELIRDWPGGFFEEGLREVLF